MIQLLALLILWALPWQLSYWPDVASLHIQQGCDFQYVADGQVSYYDGYYQTIHLCPHQFPHLSHAIIHESQHHMQLVEKMALWPGGYGAFEQAVLYEIEHGDYSTSVRNTIYALAVADEPIATYNELHAELPWILHGDIPASLQPWYVWFNPNPTSASPLAPFNEPSWPLDHPGEEVK